MRFITLKNFKLTIAYDGTNYSGWQRQKNANTIQQEIETHLSVILDEACFVHGAGRTDAGVHAKAMTAHVKTEKPRTAKAIANGLNSMLPKDIRITECEEAENSFHARFSAVGKIYSYRIFTGLIQSPTERLYTTHVPAALDQKMMKKCLEIITGTHDFSTFEAAGSRDVNAPGRGAVRTIQQSSLIQNGNDITITLQGDGFLRHMVRNIAGTLIEVGKQRRSIAEFKEAFEARDRAGGGSTAPAHGLFLEKVLY